MSEDLVVQLGAWGGAACWLVWIFHKGITENKRETAKGPRGRWRNIGK